MTVEIPTKTMKFTEARPHLSELLNRVHDKELRLKVTKGNLPVAAIVSIEDLDRLNQMDAQRDADFKVFHEISKAFADQPDDEVEEQINRAVTQVRAQRRRERNSGLNK